MKVERHFAQIPTSTDSYQEYKTVLDSICSIQLSHFPQQFINTTINHSHVDLEFSH